MTEILNIAGIPLLIVAISVFFGVKILITKDASSIRGKNSEKPKDEEAYAKSAGKLLFFFAAGTFVGAIVLFFNMYVAVGVMIVTILALGVFWKKMNDKYGV